MSGAQEKPILELGLLRIDLEQDTVESADGASGLTPRAESLLLLLCRSANKLVTREQIHDSVWAGRVVEDAAITNTIWQIRRALGEQGKDILQTRAKRGYVLAVPENAWRDESPTTSAGDAPASPTTLADAPGDPAVAPVPAESRPRRVWKPRAAAIVLLLLGACGITGYFVLKSRTDAPVATRTQMRLSPDAELTVSVLAPAPLDWLRNAVLRVAVEQAYLRDGDVVYFEGRQQRNPFAGPHLQVEMRQVHADGIVAELSLNQNGRTVRETFRGPPHRLAQAVEDLLGRTLQASSRRPAAASDALVSGLAADLRFDYSRALMEYRRAIAKDPQLAEARIAMAWRLSDLGRSRESLDIADRLRAGKAMSGRQRCKLDVLIVRIAPERADGDMCARAKARYELQRMDSRGALRTLDAELERPLGAVDWQARQTYRILALSGLQELSEMASRIAEAQRIAGEAGWERARVEFGSWRGELALQSGRIDELVRVYRQAASDMERIGNIVFALWARMAAIRAQRPSPGAMVGRQRAELLKLVERAKSIGSAKGEIEALQALARLDRDDREAAHSYQQRALRLAEEAYTPEMYKTVALFAVSEYGHRREYAKTLESVRRLRKAGFDDAESQRWNLTLEATAHFGRDEFEPAIAAVDAMEREQFDFAWTAPCVFTWLFVEARRPDRARLMRKKCPYEEYDRSGKAARGDFGLLADARAHLIAGQPRRAWPTLKPRIDELLATSELYREEAAALTLLARHATTMPGADVERLRKALEKTSAMAALDGAGPDLRFGVHVLRWRLCAAEGRDNCGPILPEWAQEDRLEARLAVETASRQPSRVP
jgi:DNA-binding winged helix-turn-helix (wHTH) protein/tetratricopeptide (TPR) repeat protein